MGENLKQYISIQHLYLKFDNCQQITIQGLKVLSESLSFLTWLDTIALDFSLPELIADESVKS